MPSADSKPRTLYDKVFQDHIVNEQSDGTILLYIGAHGKESQFLLATNSVQTDILSTR